MALMVLMLPSSWPATSVSTSPSSCPACPVGIVKGLQSPRLLDPGEYPASIDKGIVRLQLKDKNNKEKTIKLRVISVAAKP
jgi:hypothetical protein